MITVNDLNCVLMSMYREDVVTSKFGGILNFKPIGFVVSFFTGADFELFSHVWGFSINAGWILSYFAELV